ncbi:hypothetical protein J6590_053160 [Homalodisca vitripennis]|nr:hypothetical protein J6590_053160 [Homalodisca vitripennis]
MGDPALTRLLPKITMRRHSCSPYKPFLLIAVYNASEQGHNSFIPDSSKTKPQVAVALITAPWLPAVHVTSCNHTLCSATLAAVTLSNHVVLVRIYIDGYNTVHCVGQTT